MVDPNFLEYLRSDDVREVHIPLWSILTRASGRCPFYLVGSHSSMVDPNHQHIQFLLNRGQVHIPLWSILTWSD